MSTNTACVVKQEIGEPMEGFSLESIQGQEFSMEQIACDRDQL